jgi:ESS family glutamate:Na+ symporter
LTLDTSLQGFFMTMFFTSIGYTASLRMLKEGGLSVLKLVAVCAVLIVLQNLVGIGLASVFNLGPLIGMATGSIPMVGGHGTAGSFGPLLEQMGAQGAATVAIAAATFGLVMGSVIGGPIARYLIDKDNLFCFECVQEPVHKTPVVGKEAYAVDKEYFLFGIGQLLVAMGIGSWITGLITSFGVTFPSYIGAMLAAAVIRNLSDRKVRSFFQRNRRYGQRVAVDLPFNGIDGPEIVAAQRTGTAAGGNAAGADGDDGFVCPLCYFQFNGARL